MTKTIVLFCTVFGLFSTGGLLAQEDAQKSYKKEVRMEDNNGTKTLSVTITENGKVSEEIYTGSEAETKLSELTEGISQTDDIRKEVYMEEVNGEQTLTIITSKKGKVREERFTGADAERKFKELEAEGKEGGKLQLKQN